MDLDIRHRLQVVTCSFHSKTVIICNNTQCQPITLAFLWWHYSSVRCQSPCFTLSLTVDYGDLRPFHCFVSVLLVFSHHVPCYLRQQNLMFCKQMSAKLWLIQTSIWEKYHALNHCHIAVSIMLCLNFFIAQKRSPLQS